MFDIALRRLVVPDNLLGVTRGRGPDKSGPGYEQSG